MDPHLYMPCPTCSSCPTCGGTHQVRDVKAERERNRLDRAIYGYVVNVAAKLFNVSAYNIDTTEPRVGTKDLVNARYAAFHVLRRYGWPYKRIASVANRDHSTVIYAINKLKKLPVDNEVILKA